MPGARLGSGQLEPEPEPEPSQSGISIGSARPSLARLMKALGSARQADRSANTGSATASSGSGSRRNTNLEAKVGFGFFSDVYRGTWRQHTVAIKVLAEMTPRKIFVHEVEIWKKLYHPNVLELLGASSATCDPPWFLVRTFGIKIKACGLSA